MADIIITEVSPVLSYVLALANSENISLDEAWERIKPMTETGVDGLAQFKAIARNQAPDDLPPPGPSSPLMRTPNPLPLPKDAREQ